MPTGLRNPAVIGRIVAAMNTCFANWTTTTRRQRVDTIGNAVVAELTLLGVTAPNLQARALGAQLYGQFDFDPWTLKVNHTLATTHPGARTPARIAQTVAQLGDTITHEARHCEQWFRMGRLLATERRAKGLMVDGREVGNRLGINNANARNAAAAAPAVAGVEKREAEEWYESVYGGQSSFREQTYKIELNATGNAIGNNWQTSAFARYQRGLAEEEDAHGIGDEIQRQFLLGHPGVVVPANMVRHAPVAGGVATY